MVRKKVIKNNTIIPAPKMASIGPDLERQLEFMKKRLIRGYNGK